MRTRAEIEAELNRCNAAQTPQLLRSDPVAYQRVLDRKMTMYWVLGHE